MDQIAIFGEKKAGAGQSPTASKMDAEYERRLQQLKEKYGEV